MASNIPTNREYLEEIDKYAEEFNQIRRGETDKTEPDDPERIRRQVADEWFNNTIPYHTWLVHSKHHHRILEYSDNDETIDEFDRSNWDEFRKLIAAAAELAFKRDIQQRAREMRGTA